MSEPLEPVAIVGSGCRFPGGASSPSKLWDLLREPRDVLARIPNERFNPSGFYNENGLYHGSSNVTHSYLLSEDPRYFDAQFFSIKPVEAKSIDPQQRLLLETVYESLESAGLKMEAMKGSNTAVFVGQMCGDYNDILMRDLDTLPTYFATGTARSIMSNRVSYFFDWRGPSMTIDTACSSSLVAVHLAVQALRSGESRLAIAAGANLLLGPEPYVAESKLNMLSPDGRSRMWDASANGYARGDGIAAVVLKTLSAAIRDGDHIECLIRETGVNQDGHTTGITMPSSSAQKKLIRETYLRAGLDLAKAEDRCQFFEAHGTGTPAGDPLEARAISETFFENVDGSSEFKPISVGSIKTIIGHTEGTAGLAGLLKASLAIQHAVIPPNLLFKQLNPAIEPFYGNLQIRTEPLPWPSITRNAVRRASVNSFGFGGTNAHAILESYCAHGSPISSEGSPGSPFTPFVFSAKSEWSLSATLAAYSRYLKAHECIDLHNLAWTLHSRRSLLSVRVALAATSRESLIVNIDGLLDQSDGKIAGSVRVPSTTTAPRIIGIFTGQGAQWAGMMSKLIASCPQVCQKIERLEESLATLPSEDRPSWSLKAELLAEPPNSRIGEAALSQPLCTAIQIVLVDMLRDANVKFAAVVGHSSGEIAAAYAAGFISSKDALRIAYYRGLHARLAAGREGKSGAMMAVGTTSDDVEELCDLPDFQGRLTVAAINSSSSVTLSGDADAIEEARVILEDEKKFVRVLKVDKAYHSYHMEPCGFPYTQSLSQCDVRVLEPTDSRPIWVSSVFDGDIMDVRPELQGDYWRDNMVRPVKFSIALENAIAEAGPFDLAVEVGPHPALQGPARSIFQESLGENPRYTGVLARGKDDREAFMEGLGFIWKNFGDLAVDLGALSRSLSPTWEPELLKGLPSYAWDHEQPYWHSPRAARAFYTRAQPAHELLGVRSANATEREVQWRNILKPKEIPWLTGHQLQGQTVFPAAGYIAMAVEALGVLAEGKEIKLVQVRNLTIGRPITFDDEDSAAEVVITLSNISWDGEAQDTRFAEFSCCSNLNSNSESLTLISTASLELTLGIPSVNVLPVRGEVASDMIEVNREQFYSTLDELGYGYNREFRALQSLRRKLNLGTARISTVPSRDPDKALVLHPAVLDAAFQSIFLGHSWPGDGRLWSLHVPTTIQSIKINPNLCRRVAATSSTLALDVATWDDTSPSIHGDIIIYDAEGRNSILQVEDIKVIPFSQASAADDRLLFTKVQWDLLAPNGDMLGLEDKANSGDFELALAIERVALFYLKDVLSSLSPSEEESAEPHYKHFLRFARHVQGLVRSGKHPYAKASWLEDTKGHIDQIIDRFRDSVDLKLMRAVGDNLPAVIRKDTTILEHMTKEGVLNDYYSNALGLPEYSAYLARMVQQIAHRYPHMKLLEIGAGTGGVTKRILRELRGAFTSYTFTDISTGFFEEAQNALLEYGPKVHYQAFDIEISPAEQGFQEQSYDVVIASLVLHATRNLEQTLKNARRLLKPGGYLVMLEITDNRPIRIGYSMGALPSWWAGVEEGRVLSPCVTAEEWGALLRHSGFGGLDAKSLDSDRLPRPFSVIASQAVDKKVEFLRQPLRGTIQQDLLQPLTIIGGQTQEILDLAHKIQDMVRHAFPKLIHFSSFEELNGGSIPIMGNVLSLVDLDEPMFKSMNANRLSGVKQLFETSRNVLWVTSGCRANDPHANSSVGFGRSLVWEMSHIRLQFLDIEFSRQRSPKMLAEFLLRLSVQDGWEGDNTSTGLLWSTEPEIVQHEGRYLIPRIKLDGARNDRYNSARRIIRTIKHPDSKTLELRRDEFSGALEVFTHNEPQDTDASAGRVSIEVSHSLLTPIKVEHSPVLHVVAGVVPGSSEPVIALSTSHSSAVQVPKAWTMSYPLSRHEIPNALSLVAVELLTRSLLRDTSADGAIIIYEAPPLFHAHFERVAIAEGRYTTFYALASAAVSSGEVVIHQNATRREIQRLLPPTPICFLNFAETAASERVGSMIASQLPKACRIVSVGDLMGDVGCSSLGTAGGKLQEALPQALQQARAALNEVNLVSSKALPVRSVNLDSIAESAPMKPFACVIDWKSSTSIPVRVEPVDAHRLFAADKSYLLFGLTGGLGQSLVEWMISRGARHIVITSRKPNMDAHWLRTLARAGANVRVMACDITDKKSLQETYERVRAELPPIVGVANGAMVLEDTTVSDMSLQALEKVVRPKVDGSINLDELFADVELDFFIFFSSLACVFGNTGQSNYTAANMFMVSLAQQRRKRGLAGSVIDIGAMMGIGYLVRERSLALQQALRAFGYVWCSERDFHQAFAEAILAGRPGSGSDPEIMMGIRLATAGNTADMPWTSNPKFWHCVIEHQAVDAGASTVIIDIKGRLAAARTMAEVSQIIRDAFATKLAVALQLHSADDSEHDAIFKKSADELGVDSLIAVEIRSWWTKEFHVDLPVLKILGGLTIGEIFDFALGKIPAGILPEIGSIADAPPTMTITPLQQTETPVEISTPSSHTPPETIYSTAPPSDDGLGSHTSPSDTHTSSSSVSFKEDLASSLHQEKDLAKRDEKMLIREVPSEVSVDPTESEKVLSQVSKTRQLSYGQSRFWFLGRYLQDQTTFNICCLIQLNGLLRIEDLDEAVSAVGQRHEALRTCIYLDKESQQPVQGILAEAVLRLERRQVHSEDEIDGVFESVRKHTFEIERGESMRILLLSSSPTSHYLIIAYHHINMDGISLQILLADLERAYEKKSMEEGILQYSEFSEQQINDVKSGKFSAEAEYWKQQFSTMPPLLPILSVSSQSSRKPLTRYELRRVDFKITPETSARIKDVCRRSKATTFYFYLTVFEALIFRFTDVDDVCIGIADGNRTSTGAIESIGFYLNLLPLRFQRNLTQSFGDALKKTRSEVQGALANSNLPFDVLLEELSVPRSAAYSPLFQAFVNYRQGAQERRPFGNCTLAGERYEIGKTAYDLTLDIIENTNGEVSIMFMAQSSLYSQEDAEILATGFAQLTDAFSKNPVMRLGRGPVYDPIDVERAIRLGKGPARLSEWPGTLAHRVEEVARAAPDNIALDDGNGVTLTYAQMMTRANTIAKAILLAGVEEGQCVAVFQEPTADWVCSLLAIMRTGSVYVPLDQRAPIPRLSMIARDCQCRLILAHPPTIQDATSLTSGEVKIIDICELTSSSPAEGIPNCARPEDPGVIFYTSGSTGVPKGCILKHEGLVNTIENSARDFGFGKDKEIILQQSALSFDYSLWQVFSAIANGGTACILPKSKRADPRAVTEFVAEKNITVIGATPSEFISWIQYGHFDRLRNSSWRTAMSGGERLTEALMKEFVKLGKPDLDLINLYGPSEVSIYSHWTRVDYLRADEGPIPIGHTLSNHTTVIVDSDISPLPVGCSGEILIAGPGVAAGYLGNKELTQAKFLNSKSIPAIPLIREYPVFYRTGDRGRLRKDGTVMFEGRIAGDTQIKLRGIRIELQDIEEAILKTADGVLSDAVVSVSDQSQLLIAYVTFSTNSNVQPQNEKKYLSNLKNRLPLPQYMIPAMMIRLEQMPLNAHSKVDRRAIKELPVLAEQEGTAASGDELTEIEKVVGSTWNKVLPEILTGGDAIGPGSDFFHVGGNSMLLVKLQAAFAQDFGVTIPLVRLFENSTLKSMASALDDSNSRIDLSIDWTGETSIPKDMLSASFVATSCSRLIACPPQVVVLTGATGFLGRELVQRLVEDPHVTRVHCIAVRHKDGRKLFTGSSKVLYYGGDLSQPRLGLSAEEAATIFDEADAVIHNGADVSFLKTYHTLRRPNVHSTIELARLSQSRNVPIHYVSTIGVAQYPGTDPFPEGSASSRWPPTDGTDGYTASKWASERFLERISELSSLPVTIHRPSSITGEGAPDLDIMHNLLRYTRSMRAIPTTDKIVGHLDFISVEAAAAAIVSSLYEPNTTGVRYRHQSGELVVTVDGLKEHISREIDAPVEALPMREWITRAQALGMNEIVAAYLDRLEGDGNAIKFPRILKG